MRIEEVEYFYISEEILHHKGLTPKEKFMVAAYEQGIEFRIQSALLGGYIRKQSFKCGILHLI